MDNPLRFGFVYSGMLRGDDPHLTQFYISGDTHDFDNLTYWKHQALDAMLLGPLMVT